MYDIKCFVPRLPWSDEEYHEISPDQDILRSKFIQSYEWFQETWWIPSIKKWFNNSCSSWRKNRTCPSMGDETSRTVPPRFVVCLWLCNHQWGHGGELIYSISKKRADWLTNLTPYLTVRTIIWHLIWQWYSAYNNLTVIYFFRIHSIQKGAWWWFF